ncbi:hypothetical protein MJM83_34585, partial [Salmonella enterica subsp. enterica serovar Montevideo]|nr:hypothetical protein [Salmonella enterica subsp. enterica serovar Montevideo]
GSLREQFHFLRSPAPWLIFAATMFSNAGVFAWFSYIKPFMMYTKDYGLILKPVTKNWWPIIWSILAKIMAVFPSESCTRTTVK